MHGEDCRREPTAALRAVHNLIETHDGCGEPLLSDDPGLEPLGYYNGPSRTHPIGSLSPALNRGAIREAVGPEATPLRWDQRGDGDPRFVSGYPDLGAFEYQRLPDLTVDTLTDNGVRGCTTLGPTDCPLRAAIELANAEPRANAIRFAGTLPSSIALPDHPPIPWIRRPLTFSASAGPVVVVGSGRWPFRAVPPMTISLQGVVQRRTEPPPW